MGCVVGSQNKKGELNSANTKAATSAVPAPTNPIDNAVKDPEHKQQPKKMPNQANNSHLNYPAIDAQGVEQASHKASSSVYNASNIVKSEIHQSAIKQNQNSINNSQTRAEVPVIEKKSLIVHNSPAELGSIVSQGVQQMKSYVESGISKSQHDVRSTIQKQMSALPNILEEDERVHDEGVNNFAIPIKNINLQVAVK